MAKILVVEDNPAIGMVMRIALTDEGHQVEVRKNAREGLAFMENGIIPDIVLTDLIMDGMDGRELIRKMRESHKLHDIPAVIITGCVPSSDILPPENEFQGLLIKPFDIEDVICTVDRLTANLSIR